MRRIFPVVLVLGLAGVVGTGCLDDIAADCQVDADCGPGARCVDDGVKICVAGDGGSGGSGGTGGVGGVGGGIGGVGGSGGGEMIDAAVAIDVYADSTFAAFLGAHERVVREIVLRVKVGEREPIELVLADPPFESYELHAEGDGDPVSGSLRVPMRLGGASTVSVSVEAWAELGDGSLARLAGSGWKVFAVTGATEDLGRIPMTVGMEGSFDFDGDSVGDAADCAPGDPAVFPGAVDVCDGVDGDCVPAGQGGFCIIPLPEGQTARDVACGGEQCAVAVDSLETGVGALLSLGSTLLANELMTLEDPLGIAVNGADSGGPTAIVYDSSSESVQILRLGNPEARASLAPSGTLSGAIVVSPRGKLGFAAYRDGAALEVFDAPKVAAATSPTTCKIGSGGLLEDLLLTSPCAQVMLSGLSDGTSNLPLNASAAGLSVRQTSSLANAQLYVIFRNDPRLAVATFKPNGDFLVGASGLLAPFDEDMPVALSLNSATDILYAVGVGGSSASLATVSTSNNFAAHSVLGVTALPAGSCPTAVAVRGSSLLVTDSCRNVVLDIALDGAGLPTSHAPNEMALPEGCNPTGIDLLGTDDSAYPIVTCADASFLAVPGGD